MANLLDNLRINDFVQNLELVRGKEYGYKMKVWFTLYQTNALLTATSPVGGMMEEISVESIVMVARLLGLQQSDCKAIVKVSSMDKDDLFNAIKKSGEL